MDKNIFMQIGNYVDQIDDGIHTLQVIINNIPELYIFDSDYDYELQSHFDSIMMSCEQIEVYCRALRDKLNES